MKEYYHIAIKRDDNYYYFKAVDPVELICVLVDYADNYNFNLTWDDVIEVVFNVKNRSGKKFAFEAEVKQ